MQESSYGFYGTICSAETLRLIDSTSSVQRKVDSNVSGLSASGRMVYDELRLLWRAPRNRERSIPAQCSLVAALCTSELPSHTVGPMRPSAVAESPAPCIFPTKNSIFERFRLKSTSFWPHYPASTRHQQFAARGSEAHLIGMIK